MTPAQPPSQLVFVSYAHEDQDFVLSFSNQLRTQGIDVWVDQWAIPHGADWDRAIDEALARCACLLIILTPESVASDEVRGELRTALDLNKPTVPVLLRSCDVPRRLRLTQHVDLSSGQWDALGGVERVVSALHDAISADPKRKPGFQNPGSVETLVGKLRRWVSARPSYLLALAFPPIFFATWLLFRLPIPAATLPSVVFVMAGAICALALWLGSRGGVVLLSAFIGMAFTMKPLLVPFEGFIGGGPFPYTSATSMLYWLPGLLFLVIAALVALISKWSRLIQDCKRLRPGVVALLIGAATGAASYFYFSQPTLYDVYLPFRPQYRVLREHLPAVAAAVDRVASPFPPSRPLDVPLILDETRKIRSEDPSTTGHLFLYQHLTDLDTYAGGIEYAFGSDLYLHLRDTGNEPVLSSSVFAEFARSVDVRSLERAIQAPYLVVLKPLTPGAARRGDKQDLPRVGAYRMFLYDLKRDEVLLAADLEKQVDSTEELKEWVNGVLEKSAGARILR